MSRRAALPVGCGLVELVAVQERVHQGFLLGAVADQPL